MTGQQSRARILIVDDVADVRRDLRLLLEITGRFQVVGDAAGGLEAVNLALLLRPDVVMMDLAMPDMDGYEATARIKADLADCRVVALTVHSGDDSRHQAISAGCDAYVLKGTPLSELLQAIDSSRATESIQSGGES